MDRRLGTADKGHNRQYLISDYLHKVDLPHFSGEYVKSLEQNKKEYHIHRNELTTPVIEPYESTIKIIRPHF